MIFKLIKSFPCLAIKARAWLARTTAFNPDEFYQLFERASSGEVLCALFILNVWSHSYANTKGWKFDLFAFMNCADGGNRKALQNWMERPLLAMKSPASLYPVSFGMMGLAAGAGYVASSVFTDRWAEQAAVAGTAAALSTLLLSPSDQVSPNSQVIVRLGSLTWNLEDFCRNWLITGRTGSGKTAAGIANIMAQLFRHAPGWGGLCIDQKGLFYRMLIKMASHFGREKDVVLLQVRPDLAPADWKPPYVFNWLENAHIPGSSYAQLLTDVAQARGAVGSGGSSDHFVQQAKLHIGMAIESIRLVGDVPTLPEVFEFLTSPPRMTLQMGRLRVLNTPEAAVYFNHFTEKFLDLAEEELSGVPLHHPQHSLFLPTSRYCGGVWSAS